MTYRRDLERMTTLSSQDIGDACRGDRLPALINRCLDELLELTGLADEALADERIDEYQMLTQEVSAWRDTAQLLRRMSADRPLRAPGRRGAA